MTTAKSSKSDPLSNPNLSVKRVIKVTELPIANLLGPGDQYLSDLSAAFPQLTAHARGHILTLSGVAASVEAADAQIRKNVAELARGLKPSPMILPEVSPKAGSKPEQLVAIGEVIVSSRGKQIRAKTKGQLDYVQAIEEHTIVFGIGPAGTGKTYLAMAKAVQALHRKEVSRIILTRPAVEAGERLGYLPGTLNEKIDPYLRPLFDALNEMMDPELVAKLMNLGTIEVAPLAYMRGRTLNDAFVILDEAQNTTAEQMKMFLTRLGFDSKMVVTGDITQVDLPGGASGLKQVRNILNEVDDIHFSDLTQADVVRHSLVGEIVDAYHRFDTKQTSFDTKSTKPKKGGNK